MRRVAGIDALCILVFISQYYLANSIQEPPEPCKPDCPDTSIRGQVTAASACYADVSAAVNAAEPGDTVIVPPGTATWDRPLITSDGRLVNISGSVRGVIENNEMHCNYYAVSLYGN